MIVRKHGSPRPHIRIQTVFPVLLGLSVLGCHDLTGNQPLPAGTPNPSSFDTPAGARGMRNAAVYQFEQALVPYVVDAGLITDELTDRSTGVSQGVLLANPGVSDPLDERILPELSTGTGTFEDGHDDYNSLQTVRGAANQALGALVTYDTVAADTASAKVLRGELYALEGYVEIMLADLFCSGVPLSTLDFQKDYTVHASSTRDQVYHDALAKFDTALTLARDSARIMNLARVGQGRALLDLGQYAAAAAAVMTVADSFQYQLAVQWIQQGFSSNHLNDVATVSDLEGVNGLPYRSSGDPRTAVVVGEIATTNTLTNVPLLFPAKYGVALHGDGRSPFTLADGIEARLIQAEAQLQPASAPSGPWLATLNQLRESIQLGDVADPGTAAGRIVLLFQERAYWLFVTGHRQGDLRRLIRQYGATYAQFRSQTQVYPTGQYLAPGAGQYGGDVTAAIPPTEYTNPLFHGCLNRAP